MFTEGKIGSLKVPRVVIIGIGAIGGALAVNLAEKGLDLIVVTKHRSLAEKIENEGLILRSNDKHKSVKIKAIQSISDLKGKYDIIFFAMKATGVLEAARAILPYLADDGVVVTLQNGVVEDDVAQIVGRSRVIGAVVATASKAVQPGVIHRTLEGNHFIGLLDKNGSYARLQEVGKLMENDLPVIITENIYGALFSKLGINVAINGLGAISGLTVGELLERDEVRQLYLELTTEAIYLARKLGIEIIQVGAIHLDEIILNENDSPEILKRKHKKLMDALLPRMKDVKSSTLYSLEQGQASEIDYLNGYVVKKAKELNINAPYNEKIVQMVKEIESGIRSISPKNLQEIIDK